MSLVILTNDAKEQSDIVSQTQSIYKPWSFRNSLSSTMEIPANSQIALTSAKISLDGQVSLSAGEKVLFVYLGRWLSTDLNETLKHSTSYPVKVKLFEDEPGTVTTDTQGLAVELERALNRFVSHPHYAKRCEVGVNRNPTTGEFEGYDIKLKQIDLFDAVIPSATGPAIMITNSRDLLSSRVRETPAFRSYTITTTVNQDVFLTPTQYRLQIHATTFEPSKSLPPISLAGGICQFDLTRCIGNVGAVNLNINFACGLSRYFTTSMIPNNAGGRRDRLGPSYFKWDTSKETTPAPPGSGDYVGNFRFGTFYGDFVLVNSEGELRLFDTATNGLSARPGRGGNARSVRWREIDYTQGGNSPAPFNTIYNTTLNASRFEFARFTVEGERVKIEMVDGGGNATILYQYDTLRPDGVTPRLEGEIMKPIDQGCESMVPVMGIQNFGRRNDAPAVGDYRIGINQYSAVQLSDKPNLVYTTDLATYNADKDNSVIPWYNRIEQELPGRAGEIITSIDNRSQKREVVFGTVSAQRQFVNCWKPVIITSPSSQYFHTQGANSMRLLGFQSINGVASGQPIWDDEGEDADNQFVYSLVSTDIPTALSSKSIFVRVDNFNQTSTNAGNGNKSGIVAHLPRFDGQQQTGRLFFEPKNLIYLDLNNPAPMKINSFDISFVYSDETYCKSLVGSSIVTLHIREKGTTN